MAGVCEGDMELTEQSLMECMYKVYEVPPVPLHMAVSYDFVWIADRMLNQWKGKRAKWLKTKRG